LPPEDSRYEIVVDRTVGQGFLVAIASREPFRDLPWYLRPFDPQGESVGYENVHAEEEGFDEDGAVVGDPMVAMERIRRRVLADASVSDAGMFATSYASYYVGNQVRYPRYLCADCHRPGQWAWWDGFDPYYTQCSVFDFRVNWNWSWGPTCWSSHVPYYYYVVRYDCPPHYQPWYEDHSRWSSWDDHHQREDLWGGPPTRYKGPPPVGYVPPTQKPWNPALSPPPGYIAPGGVKNPGERRPLPVGRMERPDGTGKPVIGNGGRDTGRGANPPGGVWREPRKPYNPAEGGGGSHGGSGVREGERSKPQPSAPAPRERERGKPDPAPAPREERRADPPRVDPPRHEERRADPPPPPPAPAKPAPPAEKKGDRRGGN
jgi:hypothetical protein